jgi:hypothetical protein
MISVSRFRSIPLFALTLLIVMSAGTALAIQAVDQNPLYEIPLPLEARSGYASDMATLEAEEILQARFGGSWQVQGWNAASATPHLAFGKSIDLGAGAIDSAEQLESLARGVMMDNPEFFGAAELNLSHAPQAKGKWVAHFQQSHDGLEIWQARARLGFAADGRLMFLGSDLYSDIDLNTQPTLSEGAAEAIATQALPFDPSSDTVEADPVLMVLPLARANGGADLHLVWRFRVHTDAPLGIWVSHVDAHDGEILWRYNDIHFAYGGDTASETQPITWCDGTVTEAMPYLNIDVSGLGTVTSDGAGDWNVDGTGGDRVVSCDLQGPYVHVLTNYGGPEAFYSGMASEFGDLTVQFSDFNSQPDERTVFDGVNDIHDFFQQVAPEFNLPNQNMNATVSRTDGYCPGNAWWNGSINFCAAGGSYANTGEIQGVVQHEFGHGVQAAILGWQGDEGLGEGNSDVLAILITQESIIGRGFYTNNCTSGIRNADNTLIYPDDVVGHGIHDAGQVIAGFHWDAMMALQDIYGVAEGTLRAAGTWHYGRLLTHPTNQPDQVFGTFFADDDNGDLSDGTPDYYAYCGAAMNHNFECPPIDNGLYITHTPLPDTDDTAGAFSVAANVTSDNGGLDTDSITLHWRSNGASWSTVDMTVSGMGGSTFSGQIPPQQPGFIEYFITAADLSGAESSLPVAGYAAPFDFIVAWVMDRGEETGDWTTVLSADADPAGGWVRVDPVGTIAQPEDDHSTAGTNCWVTGQHTPGDAVDADDVDDGWVTLNSPTFDLTDATQVTLRYWKWFSNDLEGSGGYDTWKVQASNNGGMAWTNIEQNQTSTEGWESVTIDMMSVFEEPAQMVFRWQVFDLGLADLVEGAVDDLTLLAVWGSTGVDEGLEVTLPMALDQNVPNPFNPVTQISFTLAEAGPARLEVFDARGRRLTVLAAGQMAEGHHSVQWDGRDDAGRTAASGIYFYRLQTEAGVQSKRMLLIK